MSKSLESFRPEILVALRHRAGWTQDRLSEKSGVSRQTISSIETGYRPLSMRNAHKLADALGVPVAVLTGSVPPDRSDRSRRMAMTGEEALLIELLRTVPEASRHAAIGRCCQILAEILKG